MEEIRELQCKVHELQAASEQKAEFRSRKVSPPEHKEEIRELQRRVRELQTVLEQEAERKSRNVPPLERSVYSGTFVVKSDTAPPTTLSGEKKDVFISKKVFIARAHRTLTQSICIMFYAYFYTAIRCRDFGREVCEHQLTKKILKIKTYFFSPLNVVGGAVSL